MYWTEAIWVLHNLSPLVTQTGVDKYNSILTFAKGVCFQINQIFKFIPSAGRLKATMFDKLLLAKFPGLTQIELDHFRESIVGELNSQLTSTQLLAPAYNPTKHEADVKTNIENPIVTQIAVQAATQ